MTPPAPRSSGRVLVTLLTGRREDIDLARRRIGYRRLVLIAHPAALPMAEAVREAEDGVSDAADAPVRLVPFAAAEPHAHLARLRAVVAEERARLGRRTEFVLNAAGGDPALVMAMILLAYETGHETWFTQEGRHVRLPVLWGVRLEDRLADEEGTVLARLPGAGSSSSAIAQRIIMARERVERALRGLEKKGLVVLYAEAGRMAARPTAVGAYVQAHLHITGKHPETSQIRKSVI